MVFDIPELNPYTVIIDDLLETEYDREVSVPIPLGTFPFAIPPNDENFSTNFSSPPDLTQYLTMWLFLSAGQGEGAQIARNDGLFKAIMTIAGIPTTEFSRNTHVASTIGTTRPDFAAFSNEVPIFIAEEKEGALIADAIEDIQVKFRWIPNFVNLPFFVAFAVTFTTLSICIITRTEGGGLNYDTRNIGIVDSAGKFRALRRVIHVARVLKYFHNHNLIVRGSLQIGRWHDRPQNKSLRLTFTGFEVKVTVRTNADRKRAKNLIKFYKVCKRSGTRAQVQFIEYLNSDVSPNPVSPTVLDPVTYHFYLNPIGVAVLPRQLTQLCDAIRCVVIAIWEIHRRGWMHSDIRWPNIVKVSEDAWYVIDCYNACKVNSPEAQARQTNDHPWSTQDDQNQVAGLIERVQQVEVRDLFQVPIELLNGRSVVQAIRHGSAVNEITAALEWIRNNNANVDIRFNQN